jgi:microcystin-dependent protein
MYPSLYTTSLAQLLSLNGSETTVYVNSLSTLTGETINFSNLAPFTKGYIVVDPEAQISAQPEIISFTGIDAINFAFTGCTRGLSAVTTGSVTLNKVYHGTSAPVIISFGAQNINDIVTYINSLVQGVAGNASSTVFGLTKLTQDPATTNTPVAVGSNTSQSGTAISTSNKALDAAYLATITPAGIMAPYAGSSAPTGWLLCDGTSYSRTGATAALFAVVGTTYGSVDGSHFNVPDLRGRTIFGTGTGTKVLTFASRASNVITVTGAANNGTNEVQTGQAVLYTAASPMTGLTTATTYYIIRISATTFSLATTLANAQNATAISLSSDGSGTQTFTYTLTAHTLGDTGGEESHAMSSIELLAHTHGITNPLGSGSSNAGFASGTSTINGTESINSTGGNAAMNVMNPYLSVNYIIKE